MYEISDTTVSWNRSANGYKLPTEAADAFKVKLSADDIKYLEEMYVPHPVVGAIKENPPQGVMLIDGKK